MTLRKDFKALSVLHFPIEQAFECPNKFYNELIYRILILIFN